MTLKFDEFELDSDRVELRYRGEVIHLEPKNFELLEFLAHNRARVLSKDEVFDQIWPGVFVTEASLSGAIKNIRKALGDDGAAQRFIRTVRGRGYRFVADVKEAQGTTGTEVLRPTPDISPSGPPVLAVLSFSSSSGDPNLSVMAEAIPAELIAALSKIKSLAVLARGSTFQLDTTVHSLADIGVRLRAEYVLTGTVALLGRLISIVVELADTSSERVIWSEEFRDNVDALFSLEEKIISSVVNALDHRIPQHKADGLLQVPSEQLDAWDNYHLGVRHLYRFNAPDNAIAARYFETALRLDPRFARAVAGLSYTELENYNLGFGPDKAAHLINTQRFAERAVDLDPYDPFCNLVLARANWARSDLDAAISWATRAIDLNPNYAFGLYNLGKFNAIDCVATAAQDNLQSAMSLSPLDAHLQSMLSARGLAAFTENDGDAARHFAKLSLRAPNPHLYVCIFAAAILSTYEDTRSLTRVMHRIRTLGGEFDRDHFLSLFALSQDDRARSLVSAIDNLAL